MNPLKASVLGLLTMGAATPSDQIPCIEFSSLLDCIQITTQGTGSASATQFRIGGSGIQAAFLPGPDTWSPADLERSDGHTMVGSLLYKNKEVAKFAFYVQKIDGVFSRASVRGTTTEMEESGFVTSYKLEDPGEYQLKILIDEEERAAVSFRVKMESSGDAFDPKISVSVDGPWSQWGYFASRPDKDNAPVEFRTWLRQSSVGAQDDFELQILRSGKLIAKGGKLRIGESSFRPHAFRLGFAERNKGSFGMDSLCDVDGIFRVVILRNGKPWSTFQCEAKDGALVPHHQSGYDYAGSAQYLLPRLWSQTPSQRRTTTWCKREATK